MLACEKCGHRNDADSTICIKCGEKLDSIRAQTIQLADQVPLPSPEPNTAPDPIHTASAEVRSSSDRRQSSGRVGVIDKALYSESTKKMDRTLSKRLKAYIKDPNPDNVHDLRTAARRTRAFVQLLPENARSRRRTRKYSAKLKRLIRVNANIRDIDIILSKIRKHSDNSAHQKLVSRLVKQRAKELKPALRFASSFGKPERGLIRSGEVSDELLQKRFDKITRKLEDKIRQRLPTVLEDPAKKRTLHRLRADSRRLRYVLDLGGTPSEREPMPLLRSWQDILGLIHDSDIMIDRLGRARPSPEIQDMLRDEVAERNLNFEKFASMPATRIVVGLSEHRGRRAARRLVR